MHVAAEETLTYEAAGARLEAIIARLDSGEAGLRETLDLCREGRSLVEFCAAELEAVGQGLEELRTALYRILEVLRVYTKQPGKPPDMTSPFTCPIGSTVIEMAELVHRDFADNLKSARIWGAGVFDGQSVKRDHVLNDKDVIELHI